MRRRGIGGVESKKPCWFYKSNILLSSSTSHISQIDDIKVTYKDEELKDFSIIKVAFWNEGRETIKREDVAETVMFYPDESNDCTKIYAANVVAHTAESNEFTAHISKDEKSVSLDFKYLDKGEGAVVQIYTNSDKTRLNLKGKIMGCKILRRGMRKRLWEIVYFGFGLLLGVVVALFSASMNLDLDGRIENILALLMVIVSVGFLVSLFYMLKNRKKLTLSKMPKELEKYF